MTQKTTSNNTSHEIQAVTQTDFLSVLYPQISAGNWLELRCIHPETGEVRTLWIQVNKPKQLGAVLKQADKLNAEGFGVFFAPCLRKEKKGSVASAIRLSAMWIDIDCDDDPQKREKGMVKLCGFDPAPSIILDSGGGWHAYWLLDEPFMLETDDDKQKISQIMQGMFTALDGDENYVKSVASIMRLPNSINTKPERNNALVQVMEWHPEHRYSLSSFEWLEVKPKPQNGYLPVFLTNGNGHHPLPPRTEQYLASGAYNGNRNAELFAAACQMRDAGYSQSDAERELLARHVADGNGSENPAAREKEARATIASAYSQPAREPIASPKQHAQQVVQQLVGQYQVEQKPERPTTAQIVEAVEACVHLNSVEWAEERQRLKAVCSDGLKISDIDRLYKEKKKAVERQHQQEYVDTESYLMLDGKIIYRKETYRGTMEKTVTDWSATALYQTCQIDDDGKEAHVTTIELQRGSSVKKLDVPGDVFVDDVALRRFIGSSAGSQYVVRAGMSKHLVPAIVQLSGEFPTHRHYNFMGWMELDGRWVYVSPQDCITAKGKLAEPPSVELDQRLRDYGLQATTWQESLQAFDAVTKVLPPNLVSCLIAFALFPVLQRFFPTTATRPALHLVGTSGSGKSEIASLLSSFYGQFSRDTPPAQWGDTINTVETLGYPLADTIFWVDDYKSIYADERTFTRFLQAYSRSMGRGRLTREAKVRREKPCRGLILSTGETTIEGEMSIIARMLVLEIPPWEKRDPTGQALVLAEGLRDSLPGFTAHFASWVAKQLETGDLREEIATRFSNNKKGYTDQLTEKLGKQSNTDRVVKNWAVLVTVYQLLSKFLQEMDEDYLLPTWQDVIVESVRTLRQERASEVFLDILGQLIAGGQAVLDDDMRNPREYPSGVTVVGYKHDGFVYLLPDVTLREVNKIQPLKFTTTAIGMQLKEDGLLIPGKSNLSVQKSVRGSVIRLWRLKSEILCCEDCETCEEED
jgi:hypothetical protein